MAKRSQKTVLGVKITKNELSDDEWGTIHRFALALERGRFNEYIELLQDNRRLMWKGFISGVAKGFGAVLGATILVALLAFVLGVLGQYLPGRIGHFFQTTQDTIQQPVQ